MADFKKAQKIVGINEGGYQNDPRDTGNYFNGQLIGTNWGISAPLLAQTLNRVPSVSDMKQLSKAQAEQILKAVFWTRNNLAEVKNQSVATLIYDGVVNHGTGGMRLLLDKSIRAIGGGIHYYDIFKKSGIKYLNSLNQRKLFESIKTVRANKYKSSPKKHFIGGWLNRLNKIQYYANNTISAIWPITAMLFGLVGIILIVL